MGAVAVSIFVMGIKVGIQQLLDLYESGFYDFHCQTYTIYVDGEFMRYKGMIDRNLQAVDKEQAVAKTSFEYMMTLLNKIEAYFGRISQRILIYMDGTRPLNKEFRPESSTLLNHNTMRTYFIELVKKEKLPIVCLEKGESELQMYLNRDRQMQLNVFVTNDSDLISITYGHIPYVRRRSDGEILTMRQQVQTLPVDLREPVIINNLPFVDENKRYKENMYDIRDSCVWINCHPKSVQAYGMDFSNYQLGLDRKHFHVLIALCGTDFTDKLFTNTMLSSALRLTRDEAAFINTVTDYSEIAALLYATANRSGSTSKRITSYLDETLFSHKDFNAYIDIYQTYIEMGSMNNMIMPIINMDMVTFHFNHAITNGRLLFGRVLHQHCEEKPLADLLKYIRGNLGKWIPDLNYISLRRNIRYTSKPSRVRKPFGFQPFLQLYQKQHQLQYLDSTDDEHGDQPTTSQQATPKTSTQSAPVAVSAAKPPKTTPAKVSAPYKSAIMGLLLKKKPCRHSGPVIALPQMTDDEGDDDSNPTTSSKKITTVLETSNYKSRPKLSKLKSKQNTCSTVQCTTVTTTPTPQPTSTTTTKQTTVQPVPPPIRSSTPKMVDVATNTSQQLPTNNVVNPDDVLYSLVSPTSTSVTTTTATATNSHCLSLQPEVSATVAATTPIPTVKNYTSSTGLECLKRSTTPAVYDSPSSWSADVRRSLSVPEDMRLKIRYSPPHFVGNRVAKPKKCEKSSSTNVLRDYLLSIKGPGGHSSLQSAIRPSSFKTSPVSSSEIRPSSLKSDNRPSENLTLDFGPGSDSTSTSAEAGCVRPSDPNHLTFGPEGGRKPTPLTTDVFSDNESLDDTLLKCAQDFEPLFSENSYNSDEGDNFRHTLYNYDPNTSSTSTSSVICLDTEIPSIDLTSN